jgi:hypothetical protein
VKSTAKAIAHRVNQARSAVVKSEAAWAGFQFLFALGPVGVLTGLVLWLRRRRNRDEPPQANTAAPPATDTEAETPAPVAARSANAAVNGQPH